MIFPFRYRWKLLWLWLPTIALAIWLCRPWVLAGSLLALLGSFLNLWVVRQNQGRMPMRVPARINLADWKKKHRSTIYSLMTSKSRYRWLCDVIDLWWYVASVGDLLNALGCLCLLWEAVQLAIHHQ